MISSSPAKTPKMAQHLQRDQQYKATFKGRGFKNMFRTKHVAFEERLPASVGGVFPHMGSLLCSDQGVAEALVRASTTTCTNQVGKNCLESLRAGVYKKGMPL
jgi:hypothetical protein